MPEPARLITQRPLQRLLLMAFTGFTGFYVTLAALPAWIAMGGGSTTSAGAATTVMLATTAACQPFVPILLRRLRTTPVMALGLLALGLPAPALIWAGAGAGLYAICAIRGIGFAIFTIAGTVANAEVAPEGRLGEVTGWYGLAAAGPNVVMVPLSVLVLHEIGFWPVAVLAATPVLGAVFALALGGGWRRDPGDEVRAAPGRGAIAPAVRRSLAPAVVLFALTTAGGAVVTILPIERPGLTATAGLALLGAVTAASRWRAGIVVHRRGVVALLPWTCAITAVALLVFAAGLTDDTTGVVLFACAACGVGYGAVQSLTLVAAFARTERRMRPVASAVWNVAFDSGTGVGAVLIGVLSAGSLGIWGAFAVLSGLVAAVIPFALASG